MVESYDVLVLDGGGMTLAAKPAIGQRCTATYPSWLWRIAPAS